MPEPWLPFFANHRLHRIILLILVAITVPMLSVSLFLNQVLAVTRTWDGGGTDGTCGGGAGDGNKWSCAANWSADTVPVSGDVVVFDGTSTKDSTIDAGFAGTITSLSINSGYTGTITMARSLTMTSTYTQADGTFSQGAQTLTIAGNFAHTAGTFNANTGTVVLTGATPTLSGSTTFNNLYVATTTTSDVTLTLPASTTTVVSGATRLLASTHSDPVVNILTIVSSSSGVQASVDFQGSLTIFSAHVKDVNNINATQVHCYVDCVDDGNNTNIRFGEPGLARTTVSGNVTEAGSTATFTVALRGKPTANVIVPLSVSDATEASVSPASLTFTALNYTTPQTVTVTGVDDSEDDGGVSSTIVFGTATSVDSLYGVLDASDVSIFTEDDDQLAALVDFDNAALLTEEDVKGTAVWFDQTNQGEGTLKTGSGGAAVSLTGTKILPGCRATIGGVDFIISRLSPTVTGQVLLTDGVTRPENLHLVLADGAVTKIVCTIKPVNDVQLGGSSSSIAVRSTLFPGSGYTEGRVFTDNTNGRVWFTQTNSLPALKGISMTTGLETISTALTGETGNAVISHDSTRDTLWLSEYALNKVVAINAATGAYAFGTLGASSFTIAGSPWSIAYNPELDEIWVLTNDGHEVKRINPADGAVVGTVALSFSPNRIVYDSTQHAMWVEVDNTYSSSLIKLSATSGTFANVTESASLFPVPDVSASDYGSLLYDSSRNVLWETSYREADGVDKLNKIDASTGAVIGSYPTGAFTNAAALDPVTGNVLVAYSNYVTPPAEGGSAGVMEFDAATGERIATYTSSTGLVQSMARGTGNINWILDIIENELSQSVIGGAPVGKFYTTLTTSSSDVDIASGSTLSSVSASASEAGEIVSFALTFDGGNSYKVYGSWRVIASNKAGDHGGTDGVWYYRDDADAWTAAPSNAPAEAVSLAVENGPTHNRMTAGTLNGLGEDIFQQAGGFSTSTTSVGVSVTLSTADSSHHPSADTVTFNFAPAPTQRGTPGTGTPGGLPPVTAPTPETPEPLPEPLPEIVTPISSFPEGTTLVPGDYVRSLSSSTVYLITSAGTRRPFMNAKVFFTYISDFSAVKFVSDSFIEAFVDGQPMPPKPGTVLVKTPSSDRVYAFAPEATIEHPEIRWIQGESLARNFFGLNWADYVIDLDQPAIDQLPVGEPLTETDVVDSTQLLRRVDLARRVSEFINFASVHLPGLVEWASIDTVHFPFWPKFHK
ncbi:MAG: hypothetical protein WC813_00395 [Patescibacteria group bacterium]|jgi:hypothetical protein